MKFPLKCMRTVLLFIFFINVLLLMTIFGRCIIWSLVNIRKNCENYGPSLRSKTLRFKIQGCSVEYWHFLIVQLKKVTGNIEIEGGSDTQQRDPGRVVLGSNAEPQHMGRRSTNWAKRRPGSVECWRRTKEPANIHIWQTTELLSSFSF